MSREQQERSHAGKSSEEPARLFTSTEVSTDRSISSRQFFVINKQHTCRDFVSAIQPCETALQDRDYDRAVRTFADAREAKEFLIGKLLDRARRDGYPMSEIERKMLYFSETWWTLPDILEVNEVFEREYDLKVYEWKVSHVAKNFRKAALQESDDLASWNEALRVLRSEDHYLVVLIDLPEQAETSLSDRFRLIAVALALVVAIMIGVFLYSAYTK